MRGMSIGCWVERGPLCSCRTVSSGRRCTSSGEVEIPPHLPTTFFLRIPISRRRRSSPPKPSSSSSSPSSFHALGTDPFPRPSNPSILLPARRALLIRLPLLLLLDFASLLQKLVKGVDEDDDVVDGQWRIGTVVAAGDGTRFEGGEAVETADYAAEDGVFPVEVGGGAVGDETDR